MSRINVANFRHPDGTDDNITLDSSGRVGVGTTSPGTKLQIDSGNAFDTLRLNNTSGGTAVDLGATSTGDFAIRTGATESARIDAAGRLLVGTPTSIAAGSVTASTLQVSQGGAGIGATFYSTTPASGPAGVVVLGHGRTTAAGLLFANDVVGQIRFAGGDGVDLQSQAAAISAEVDGTPGANDMPGRLVFSTTADGASSPTERMRIDANGNVSVGAAQNTSKFNVLAGASNSTIMELTGASAGRGLKISTYANTANDAGVLIEAPYALYGQLAFGTAGSERLRIDSSGRLLVGTSTAPLYGSLQVYKSGSNISSFVADSGFVPIFAWNKTTGNGTFIEFGTGTSYSIRGSITYNSGTGQTSYNLVSDYRAKSLLGNVENSGETIDALKVYRGVMNGATVERPMLVAHEAQEVAPYCVTGEKDAVDDDGNPIYQQMDHQVLVPLLIAEIQQLRARVAALESA